jgi:hypothetical protein
MREPGRAMPAPVRRLYPFAAAGGMFSSLGFTPRTSMGSPMPPAAAAKVGHPEILSALQETFPSGVFLLARLDDPSLLPGSDPAPQVFIPDTHIVPASDVKQWPGHVLTPSRADSLARLLDALDRLRQADPSLVVWQLGDLVDLWTASGSP